jgi:hypothetical protein
VNVHIQFVYGFFLLGLATSESLINRILRRFGSVIEETAIAPARIAVVTAACVAATLVNPYHYRIYLVVLDLLSESGFYNLVSEMLAPQFRIFTDYIALGLAVGAAFALGWRRNLNPFLVLLLLTGLFASFHSRRDIWFVAVASVAVIASPRSSSSTARYFVTRAQVCCIALALCILIGFTMRKIGFSESALELKVSEKFPVAAASFVADHGYSGPLYNHFDWGGYLIWRLHGLPVAIDGRGNVHGVERTIQSQNVWNGAQDWASDPALASSRLVIAERDKPLCSLLRFDARFELVYEDKVAAVFVARTPVTLAAGESKAAQK